MEWRSENWLEKSGKIGPDDRKFAFLVKIQCGPIGPPRSYTVRDFGFLNTRTPTAGLCLQFDTATSG
jgi:hypothetical protein